MNPTLLSDRWFLEPNGRRVDYGCAGRTDNDWPNDGECANTPPRRQPGSTVGDLDGRGPDGESDRLRDITARLHSFHQNGGAPARRITQLHRRCGAGNAAYGSSGAPDIRSQPLVQCVA